MNTWLKILAIACVVSPLTALAETSTDCVLRVVESPTKFPLRSQLRGQEGIVQLNAKVDENGRVFSAELTQSSGYRLLDRAAQQSVRNDWVFDVSGCTRKDLPADRLVSVEYRNDEYR